MTQQQLNRAVARLTGESVKLIRLRGFTVLKQPTKPRLRKEKARDCLQSRPGSPASRHSS